MNNDSERQSGRTANQIISAPLHAIFIWVNDIIDYPIQLAKYLNRDDLKIVKKSWLKDANIRVQVFSGIVVDHATVFDDTQQRAYLKALTRIRDYPVCDVCHKPNITTSLRIDPYAIEIEDKHIELMICDTCYQDRCDDI